MNDTKIYIKGRAGFKLAVKSKLGDAWTHSDMDSSVDEILLVMTEESEIEALKASVGKDLIAVYELQFLTNLYESLKGQRFNGPLKMSIWTSKDSNIKARNTQLPQHDPGVMFVDKS